MFERFTDRARRTLVLAQEEARHGGAAFIGSEHLLLGLLHEGDGVAAKVLKSFNLDLESMRDEVERTLDLSGRNDVVNPPYTPRAKKILELALREALQLGHSYIGTEHILLGLIREGEGIGAQVLARLGIDLDKVRQRVIQVMSGTPIEIEPQAVIAESLGASQRLTVDPLTVYQLRLEIARLRDHIARMKMALSVMADGDMPHELALRKALEALTE